MATSNNGGQTPPGGAPQQSDPGQAQAAQAQFRVLAQYTKDFSFENPNAPQSVSQQPQQPSINIQINVNPKQLSDTSFEVELKLEGKAEVDGSTLFAFDLVYAGVFHLQGIPQESVGPLIMIECPRMLFPFAREIIASAIVSGGFPPLMLDPIDFVALYQQKLAHAQQQQQEAPAQT
ncbi:MAG TPA: protein-export chaperone SecB [Xanthobacteraceae bacterium]|nr:protein-export chaperone SecB [Xanthobacteraceae bacterium]